MIPPDLLEKLAAIEHERWADWQGYVHRQCCQIRWEFPVNTFTFGGTVIPQPLVERWERQIDTPYAELSESEKESDREDVLRYWPAIADWLKGASDRDILAATLDEDEV